MGQTSLPRAAGASSTAAGLNSKTVCDAFIAPSAPAHEVYLRDDWCFQKNEIMHLTDDSRYVIVMVKEIDHDTSRVKQRNLS
jgi:hypothetical protein